MAKRHPTSTRKPGSKDPDEPEDVLLAHAYKATTWAQHNRLTLVVLAIVGVVLVVGVWSWVDYRNRLTEQAVGQLEEIQQTVSIGDPETAKAELDQYLQRFGGTPYAAEARLLLAGLYLDSDQPAEATAVLEASGTGLDEPLGVQIETMKAAALEEAGRHEEAIATYLRVAERADLDFQVVQALADAARLSEHTGDYAGAAELYERILDELEEDAPERGRYEMVLAEARARADA